MNAPRKPFLALTLATWFGCGYSPVAPGTVGSLAAVLLALPLIGYHGFGRIEFAVLAALTAGIGIWAGDRTAKYYQKKDPGYVVIDEVAGQWFALAGASVFNWKSILAAFLLFRMFDIWKPFPARQAESLRGGLGIMMDDVVAGIYAALVLWAAGCFNLY
ncbi:MAG: phosphatidylglycerophosphatase A [Acidobacteria bacterium]|nr:phosphatidylglycerophosphatase A [Acidobacteriota bacterium]